MGNHGLTDFVSSFGINPALVKQEIRKVILYSYFPLNQRHVGLCSPFCSIKCGDSLHITLVFHPSLPVLHYVLTGICFLVLRP